MPLTSLTLIDTELAKGSDVSPEALSQQQGIQGATQNGFFLRRNDALDPGPPGATVRMLTHYWKYSKLGKIFIYENSS